jgi:hypothetical protein
MQRLAAALGILGGAAWLGLAWVPAECAPVTAATEVFCNRLWTPPLLAMFVAALAWLRAVRVPIRRAAPLGLAMVAIGYALMAAGNGAEYWLADRLPHEGPDGWVRGVLWMSALAGWLAVLVGSTLLGAAGLRARLMPTWAGTILLLAIPVTVALGAVGYPTAALGIVGIVIGVVEFATAAGAGTGQPSGTAALA